MKEKKERIPGGIQILSIIYLVSILFSIGIIYIVFMQPALLQNLPGFNLDLTQTRKIIVAIFFVIFIGIAGYIGRGLRKKDKRAKNLFLIISSINIAGGAISIIRAYDYLSIINIILNSIAITYVLKNKRVQKFFM